MKLLKGKLHIPISDMKTREICNYQAMDEKTTSNYSEIQTKLMVTITIMKKVKLYVVEKTV